MIDGKKALFCVPWSASAVKGKDFVGHISLCGQARDINHCLFMLFSLSALRRIHRSIDSLQEGCTFASQVSEVFSGILKSFIDLTKDWSQKWVTDLNCDRRDTIRPKVKESC
jgi:hypothetical protein